MQVQVLNIMDVNECLLSCIGLLQISRGYHETVTMFYTHIIHRAMQRTPVAQTFDEFLAQHPYLLEKDLLFEYYSHNAINLPNSKTEYVFKLLITFIYCDYSQICLNLWLVYFVGSYLQIWKLLTLYQRAPCKDDNNNHNYVNLFPDILYYECIAWYLYDIVTSLAQILFA